MYRKKKYCEEHTFDGRFPQNNKNPPYASERERERCGNVNHCSLRSIQSDCAFSMWICLVCCGVIFRFVVGHASCCILFFASFSHSSSRQRSLEFCHAFSICYSYEFFFSLHFFCCISFCSLLLSSSAAACLNVATLPHNPRIFASDYYIACFWLVCVCDMVNTYKINVYCLRYYFLRLILPSCRFVRTRTFALFTRRRGTIIIINFTFFSLFASTLKHRPNRNGCACALCYAYLRYMLLILNVFNCVVDYSQQCRVAMILALRTEPV